MLGTNNVPMTIEETPYPDGRRLPDIIDQWGFRIAEGEDPRLPPRMIPCEPLILALGCSFTFGYYCKAEEAYPHLLQERLSCRVLNGGLSGYGLAQMVLRGKPMVEKWRPDLVILQFSPWLLDRSMHYFMTKWPIPAAVPFYAASADSGKLYIHRPVLFGGVLVGENDSWKTRGIWAECKTFWHISRAFVNLDSGMCGYMLGKLTGSLASPASNRMEVLSAGYGTLFAAAHECNAHVIVLVLNNGFDDPLSAEERAWFERQNGVQMVDAHCELVDRLKEKSNQAYVAAYQMYGNTPLNDDHPPPAAHELIAGLLEEPCRRVLTTSVRHDSN